jgi:endonuclease YncB( thermonuclease family)
MRFNLIVLTVLAALPLIAPCARAELLHGRVTAVRDGGTLAVIDGKSQPHSIRLANIAAPDLTQRFGKDSQTHLSAMVYGKNVRVSWDKIDRYGRKIAQVALCTPGCTDINLQQIKAGMAWHHSQQDEPEQAQRSREDYVVAEFNAKIRRFGLWSDKNPLPPREYISK